MSLTRELLDFEAGVVKFREVMDKHVAYLFRELTVSNDSVILEMPEFDEMTSALEDEITRMKKSYRDLAGDLLLRAVEVSKRCIEVENDYLRKMESSGLEELLGRTK